VTAPSEDWPRDPGGVPYPPPPWHLHGTLWVSLWQVPEARAPIDTLGDEMVVQAIAGRALVATAFAAYGPKGDLAYGEVLAAMRIRVRGRTFTHVPRIWVDHPSSIAGARTLWRIPKEAARFRFEEAADGEFAGEAETPEGSRFARLGFRPTVRLPGRWPVWTHIAQRSSEGEEASVVTNVRAWARVTHGRAAWDMKSDGPLGFLAGLTPMTSLRLHDVTLTFGG